METSPVLIMGFYTVKHLRLDFFSQSPRQNDVGREVGETEVVSYPRRLQGNRPFSDLGNFIIC